MIPSIIIIGIAFAWLMAESDWLRIDLMGNPQKLNNPMLLLACPIKRLGLPAPKAIIMVTPAPIIPKLLDTVHFKPSVFEALDMPEFTGDVNILCRRAEHEYLLL